MQPPGAYDLPNVFDNAMKLLPNEARMSPPKMGWQSPKAADAPGDLPSGSPTRRSNKENAPLDARPGHKEQIYNQAAASRREPYRAREATEPARPSPGTQRGLSPEEMEKLRKPSVKRLANVTQLCTLCLPLSHILCANILTD